MFTQFSCYFFDIHGPEGLFGVRYRTHFPRALSGHREDRRGERTHDPELRLLRDLRYGRAQLRGFDLRPG